MERKIRAGFRTKINPTTDMIYVFYLSQKFILITTYLADKLLFSDIDLAPRIKTSKS